MYLFVAHVVDQLTLNFRSTDTRPTLNRDHDAMFPVKASETFGYERLAITRADAEIGKLCEQVNSVLITLQISRKS